MPAGRPAAVLAPSGISLAGQTVIYASVGERPPRYWPVLSELAALAGRRSDVITASSVFAGGDYTTADERIAAYYIKLGQLLDRSTVLVILPADDSTLGSSAWNTMVVAQQRGADILLVAPTGHLRHLDQVRLELLPEGRSFSETIRRWARIRWVSSKSFPRLAWSAPAKEARSLREEISRPHLAPQPADPTRLVEPRRWAPRRAEPARPGRQTAARAATPMESDVEREAAFETAFQAELAKTTRPLARARLRAHFVRARAARAAVQAARVKAIANELDEAGVSRAVAAANTAVMRRSLAEFMDDGARRSLEGKGHARVAGTGAQTSDGAVGLSAGELKALRTAKPGKARLRTAAGLAKGAAARQAAQDARQAALAAGASAEEVDLAVARQSQEVMRRPTEEFQSAGEELLAKFAAI